MKIERKWQMTRLAAGDWLLPSNDRSTVFRISTYEDLYASHDDREEYRTYWGAWRWPRPIQALVREDYGYGHGYDPLEDWDAWVQIVHYCDTRREAIDAALRWEWEQANPIHGPARERSIGSLVAMFARAE